MYTYFENEVLLTVHVHHIHDGFKTNWLTYLQAYKSEAV